jgi:hypothetical protein
VWNGTTSGVRLTDGDWIGDGRDGLSICDATSAAFAMELPWPKLDVVTWSWQKVLGGEAAHGMLALSPRAVARLEAHRPVWPLPKIFRLTKEGRLIEGIFRGDTINTPSMLCVEDALDGLRWAEGIGGLPALVARSEANLAAVAAWEARSPWARFLAETPATRSCTSVCLRFREAPPGGEAAVAARMIQVLEAEGVALDVASYRDAPPGCASGAARRSRRRRGGAAALARSRLSDSRRRLRPLGLPPSRPVQAVQLGRHLPRRDGNEAQLRQAGQPLQRGLAAGGVEARVGQGGQGGAAVAGSELPGRQA